jgi:hypothetical protein
VRNDEGISELLDETLILGLVIVCAAIIGVMVMGFAIPIEKTAYVVSQFGIKEVSGKSVVSVFDRGGDPLYFSASGLANYKAAFYVDTSAGSFLAVPDATLSVLRPGDTIYLYYTGTGFIATNDLSGAPVVSLPAGKVAVRLVDINSGVLIAGETVVEGASGTATASPTVATPAPTLTATTNVTATPTTTANITPTTTTATPTATATTPAGTAGVTVSWSPPGLGTVIYQPSTMVTNGQTVYVPISSSATFTFSPNAANKAIQTISLDGTVVYTGSAKGTPVSYTISGVTTSHALSATFATV